MDTDRLQRLAAGPGLHRADVFLSFVKPIQVR